MDLLGGAGVLLLASKAVAVSTLISSARLNFSQTRRVWSSSKETGSCRDLVRMGFETVYRRKEGLIKCIE